MNLVDLLLTVCIRFLAWVFTAPGRYRVARQRWNYKRYQAALAALVRYVWGYANALHTHRRWSEYMRNAMAEEALIQNDINAYGFWVSKNGRRVDPAEINGMRVEEIRARGYVARGFADVATPRQSDVLVNINVQPEPWKSQGWEQSAGYIHEQRLRQQEKR